MSEKTVDDLLISEHHVAEWLRRHVATVRNYANDPDTGFPQPTMIRRRRYFRAGEIEAWARRFSDRFAAFQHAA